MLLASDSIPKADAVGRRGAYDGTTFAATVFFESDGSYFSFDSEHILIGEFDTHADAVRAIPAMGRA